MRFLYVWFCHDLVFKAIGRPPKELHPSYAASCCSSNKLSPHTNKKTRGCAIIGGTASLRCYVSLAHLPRRGGLFDDDSAGEVRAADDVEARGERELVARGEGYEAAGDVVDVLVEAIGPGEGD